MMRVVIIDYGAGNVQSVSNATSIFLKADELCISANPQEIKSATHLILPGVGSFAGCMNGLQKNSTLISAIKDQVIVKKKPFFGICVGMQVLAAVGYENGKHEGLGFIDGKVEKIELENSLEKNLKVPHMGWNNVILKPNQHPVLEGIKTGDHFYFANSYHFLCDNENNVLMHFAYGRKMTAAIAKENIFAVQFHPEKSGEAGLKLLKNFVNWRPEF